MSIGILTGCNTSQEWLLSFFWDHLQTYNSLPVAFADFGMSTEAKAFCKQRGIFITPDFSDLVVAQPQEIQTDVAALWEKSYGASIWAARDAWFKKPIAMLSSPFEKTLWLDLDCEILSDFSIVFDYCTQGLALAKEPKGDLYNSGVVVFQKNAKLLLKWAEMAKCLSSQYSGDQEILSDLINNQNAEIQELPDIYNWRMSQGLNINAVIVHWVGKWGKNYIKEYGGLNLQSTVFQEEI
jgi:hypothetical protein